MSVVQMTPFRQALKAYSTLINLPAEIARSQAALEHQMRVLAEPAPTTLAPPARAIDIYERMGFSLMLDQSSLVDRAIIEEGWWERPQLEFMINTMLRLPGSIFLDVGAYWGLYSMMASRGDLKAIYAFEPDRHNHAQLRSQLFLNDLTSAVTVINKAVSDHNGPLTFWDSRSHPDGNRAGVGVVPPGTTDRVTYPVDAVTIDDCLNLSGETLIIKLDVESHEHAALRGLKKTVEHNKVIMQVEIFDSNEARTLPEVEALGLREIHRIAPDRYYTNM
jgi:FkbM family methyltransferase